MDDRRDDWRHGVDENLASLNAGQRIWERELKAARKALAEIDGLLRGDTGRETDGLIARLHKLETDINLLKAVTLTDKAGNPGLDKRVSDLEERRADKRARGGDITKVLVAIITSGALGLFWRDIRTFFMRKSTDPVEQMIDNVIHPKPRHRHLVIREVPAEDSDPE